MNPNRKHYIEAKPASTKGQCSFCIHTRDESNYKQKTWLGDLKCTIMGAVNELDYCNHFESWIKGD